MKAISKKTVRRHMAVRVHVSRKTVTKPVRRTRVRRQIRSLTDMELTWRKQAYLAGRKDALAQAKGKRVYGKKLVNPLWVKWLQSQSQLTGVSNYAAASNGYSAGYYEAVGRQAPNWILLPTLSKVGAIVTVRNAEGTIGKVLEELNRMPLHEIIVIVYGSTDRTLERIRGKSDALIIHYPERIGPHVGRAIGAKLSKSDILLFLEGEEVIRAQHVIPFLQEIEQGAHIALNNRTPHLPPFAEWDALTVMKQFLNISFNRPDLQANSLSDVPHALSRHALNHVDYNELMVPPKALIHAILAGLHITSPASIPTMGWQKEPGPEKLQQGIGDHVEALECAMRERGERIDFPDLIRKREIIKEE